MGSVITGCGKREHIATTKDKYITTTKQFSLAKLNKIDFKMTGSINEKKFNSAKIDYSGVVLFNVSDDKAAASTSITATGTMAGKKVPIALVGHGSDFYFSTRSYLPFMKEAFKQKMPHDKLPAKVAKLYKKTWLNQQAFENGELPIVFDKSSVEEMDTASVAELKNEGESQFSKSGEIYTYKLSVDAIKKNLIAASIDAINDASGISVEQKNMINKYFKNAKKLTMTVNRNAKAKKENILVKSIAKDGKTATLKYALRYSKSDEKVTVPTQNIETDAGVFQTKVSGAFVDAGYATN